VAGAAWLVVNPAAGGGLGARHAAVAARRLHDAGIACRLVHAASPTDTRRTAATAVSEAATAVIACGGDGTVHEVLQAVVGTGVPLGIVAGGSGDDIAANLGFETSGAEAIAANLVASLASGSTRQVDVGDVRTSDGAIRHFVGVLTTGFDSSVNERANQMTRLRGQRYNVAMVRELASFRPLPYEVTIDGEPITAPGMLVSVGNGSRYGGGMLICPAARNDDGLLDVTWLGSLSTASLLRLFPRVYRGTHVDHPAVRTFRGRSLTIDAPGQIAYADGERIGPLPVQVEIRPGSLRVLSGRESAKDIA
jgi:diacylglycerol kinase (ATP)